MRTVDPLYDGGYEIEDWQRETLAALRSEPVFAALTDLEVVTLWETWSADEWSAGHLDFREDLRARFMRWCEEA